MNRVLIILTLCAMPLLAKGVCPKDTVPEGVAMHDTLRTLIVTDDGRLPIKVGVSDEIRVKTLSDILGQSTVDKIMHPFAIRRRKQERHQRKMMELLEEYDKVKTPNELLIEALRREGIDPDSLKRSMNQ